MNNNGNSVTLNGKTYPLQFNLNTFEAFEEKSGQFFLDFLMSMQKAVTDVGLADPTAKLSDAEKAERGMEVARRVSMKNVRALLWAAMHTYDKDDNPTWPMTIGGMSKLITTENFGNILSTIWIGAQGSLPESGTEERPTKGEAENKPQPQSLPANGGSASGPSDEDVLASLQKVSAG